LNGFNLRFSFDWFSKIFYLIYLWFSKNQFVNFVWGWSWKFKTYICLSKYFVWYFTDISNNSFIKWSYLKFEIEQNIYIKAKSLILNYHHNQKNSLMKDLNILKYQTYNFSMNQLFNNYNLKQKSNVIFFL
jgi:hypothetical protein